MNMKKGVKTAIIIFMMMAMFACGKKEEPVSVNDHGLLYILLMKQSVSLNISMIFFYKKA